LNLYPIDFLDARKSFRVGVIDFRKCARRRNFVSLSHALVCNFGGYVRFRRRPEVSRSAFGEVKREGAALLPLPLLWMRMGIRSGESKSLGCERGERFRCAEGKGGLACE
jgi:hypothetical protein